MAERCLRDRPLIEVKNLRKEYPVGDEVVVALKRINLNIRRGEICCIFGTSGSGKSTLLNQLAGMEKPTRGGVLIGGVPVSQLDEDQLAAFRQRHLGFVFQSYNLLPGLTATENVAMKALGCYVRDIRLSFLAEAGAIGLLGGLIGCFVSVTASVVINVISFKLPFSGAVLLKAIVGGEDVSRLSIVPPWLMVFAVLFSVAIGLGSGYYPANKAVRISALEAIKASE